jgi:hypothetical protein
MSSATRPSSTSLSRNRVSLIQDSTPAEAEEAIREFRLCELIGNALNQIYPGHLWAVSSNGGVTYVRNLSLHGMWGYVLHNHRIMSDDPVRLAIKAGGELLERWNVSRSKAGPDQAMAILLGTPVQTRQLPEGIQ